MIAGHGRLMAAKAEKISHVPVIVAEGWSDEQCRVYGLVDNRVAESATWDRAVLDSELEELDLEFGIDLSGFGLTLKDDLDDDDIDPQLGNDLTYSVIVRCESEAEQTKLLARPRTKSRRAR